MRKIIIVSLLVAMLAAGALYLGVSKQQVKIHTGQKEYKIAILTPITHPALEEVEQGFKETMQAADSASYLFTTFNANGNRTLLRAQAEEIVVGNYDLIFTIGAASSQTVAQLAKKKDITTPQVFGAVDSQTFAQELADSNPFTTGVYVKTDYVTQMDILHKLKPATKNILLVYDPTNGIGLEKDKKEIEQHLKKYGTTLHCVEIYQTNEIQQKVSALLPAMDVILVLIDNTVVAGVDALITLCNRYGVTLLVSDLASGQKGAALAYGITEHQSGAGAAQKAHQILIDGQEPHALPITAITNFKISVNKNSMQAQNLAIDDQIIKVLKIGVSS